MSPKTCFTVQGGAMEKKNTGKNIKDLQSGNSYGRIDVIKAIVVISDKSIV